ncbi:MAG: patatin-like phospholipase family protein [Bacteroidales bacterium]|nr:patatin-like phospholipase family protein [Bacteroidales bacterium]
MPATAQSYPNGLAADSIDPVADAEIIAKMRKHMDKIHTEQHRPTVGLVLSGGGAKGAAHVGVLRYLEEQEIPVDAIFGTSMGGLVGGLAAAGYKSASLDSLLRSLDWGVMLTDRIDRQYYSFHQKKYRETYVMSIPFSYAKKDFQTRIDDQVRYSESGQQNFGRNTLVSSLPSGYVYGFNVNNLLSSLTVGYQDDMSFDELPVPFFCVAADMVSIKTKYWSYGSLKTAMRSTMSIPAMFKPVRTKGMVLVDGGVRNNFPVDLAKAMGCDIIIGVSLSDKDLTYSQVNNLVDIVNQFVTMLGRESMQLNKDAADVFIKPYLEGYNMLSFDPVAIDTMIHRGYVAAQSKASKLSQVKNLMPHSKPYLNKSAAVDIRKHPVQIYAVEFDGLTNSESHLLQRKIRFKAGSYVDAAEMERMMSEIEATGCFSTVTYSIKGKNEPYKLVFNCEKGPRHQFGMGVRFDTEEWPSFLFNVGFNAHKLAGFKLFLEGKLGRNQKASARAALDLSWLPTVNAEASIYHSAPLYYPSLSGNGMEFGVWGHSERVYLSNIRWKKLDLQLGAQNRFFALSDNTTYSESIKGLFPGITSGDYVGAFFKGTLFTQDRFNYPSKGVLMTLGYDFDLIKIGVPEFKPLHTAYFNFNSIIPMGKRFAVVPDLHLRALIGSPALDILSDYDPGYSMGHQNYVGGLMPDRNVDGQIPFIGFGNLYQADPYLAVLNLGFRFKAAERVFLTATGGYMREAKSVASFLETPLPTTWGAGAEVAYNSIIGPVRLVFTWSDRNHSFAKDYGLYLSFGFDF